MYVEELYAHLSHEDAYTLKVEIEACQARSYYRRHDVWLNLKNRWEAHIQYFPPQRNEGATCEIQVFDGEGRERGHFDIFIPPATRKFDPCLTFKESTNAHHHP